MKKRYLVCIAALLVSLLAMPTVAQDAQTPAEICQAALPAADPASREFAQPEQVLQPTVDYRAIFCTEAGPVYVDLFEQYAPITVNSFVFLAQNGYYNNTTFHRVIQDFMAQGGDPTATGTGGPGYQFQNEVLGFLNFADVGVLAMANAGPDTNGSQFFITTAPAEYLNFQYNVFGQVLEGQENVEGIRLRDPDTATEAGSKLDTVVIITDPATVTTTYESPDVATQDEVQTAFDATYDKLTTQLQLPTEIFTLDTDASGVFTSEQVVAAAPEAEQTTLKDFLDRHNFEYRAVNRIANTACDIANVGIISMSYTLDSFASPEDAAAALADAEFEQLSLQSGFTESKPSDNLTFPLFTETTTECDVSALHAMTYWQRGHFVATVEITVPADSSIAQSPDLALSQGVGLQIYEPLFADLLKREIR
jgi:cyclophilin family peptidyl-prolyl cis-trans isomerase